MNEKSVKEILPIIFEGLNLLVSIGGMVVFNNKLFLLTLFITPILFVVYIIKKYILLKEYVDFVEFLMNNNEHKFVLLPKIRMYLHSEKINNKVDIRDLKIMYNIKPSDRQEIGKLYGDAEIIYDFTIKNNHLPQNYDFIYSNDYSNNEINLGYKFNEHEEYTHAESNSEKIAPYWKGRMRHDIFYLDRTKIPLSNIFHMYVKVNCSRLFEFEELGRDTIVSLPKVFSDHIDNITYIINLEEFSDKIFFCAAKRIYKHNRVFKFESINCERINNKRFESKVCLSNMRGEKAIYFRVGLSEKDPEYV